MTVNSKPNTHRRARSLRQKRQSEIKFCDECEAILTPGEQHKCQPFEIECDDCQKIFTDRFDYIYHKCSGEIA